MKSSTFYFALVMLLLGTSPTLRSADNLLTRGVVVTHDIVVPAGTLMTCTLDEPKFSSATVSVGDPFLCHPRSMQQFGQVVFPRGAYFVGHLESDKDPGHFVGKGYLKLAFDRVGLPDTDIPLTAKVIAVAGYNVDREGKVIGHGHPTRDVVEWMLPPLWPWKVLTLPARGPRPTLKGEVRVTLRVMDDLIVPRIPREAALPTAPGWHRFGQQPSALPLPGNQSAPRAIAAVSFQPAAPVEQPTVEADTQVPAGLQVQPVEAVLKPSMAVTQAASAETTGIAPRTGWPANVTLFALADGTVFPATQYWRDQNQLLYLAGGDKGTVALRDVDWSVTARLNSARGVRVTLRNLPVQN